jgi:hypothetical protein
MKKLLIMMTASIFFVGVNAQDAADKKVQAGLVLGAGLNFTEPENELISKPAAGTDLVVGMSVDWHFSDNIALATGLEFEFGRFRYDFKDAVYIDYNSFDKEILTRSSDQPLQGTMLLDERRYRSIYATLPIMIKFQTNYLGYLRYFGKFGIRNSFLLKSRGDNYGSDFDLSTFTVTEGAELLDMRIPGDMSFYKGSIGLSGGAEWNFSGGTCLVGELGYFYGFTNLHNGDAYTGEKDKNMSIYKFDGGAKNYVVPNARQGQLLLRVSLLF